MNPATGYSLLVVDDEPDLCTVYELALLREGYAVETAATVGEAWAALQARQFDGVITDMRLPDGSGLDLLQRLEQSGRSERCIVITAYGSTENAVQALKAGAYDYLTKPVDLRQFRSVVASALGRRISEAGPARKADGGGQGVWTVGGASDVSAPALQRMAGDSPAMQAVRAMVSKVAQSMAPVLVHGESGTGKELVARAIHQVGQRAGRPFVAVNCGAIPEQLLEAEFFGYRKGAFTGANEDREGFFQAAAGGTLFLDEIGDLPLSMQSKLLRVIQERAVRPVGAVHEVSLDVRILSATHKDLAEEVRQGRFRQDLYYRLNVIQIRVPALRERLEDLPALCARMLSRIASEHGQGPALRLTPAALAALAAYRFPGNVRELENVLQRSVALCAGGAIDVDDLGLSERPDAGLPGGREMPLHRSDADELGGLERSALPRLTEDGLPGVAMAENPKAGNRSAPPLGWAAHDSALAGSLPCDLVAHLDEVEREILVRALEQHRYNRTAAGASLGLTLRQMRYRMARLGIGGDE